MKKLLYVSLVAAALIVQPVSGSDAYIPAHDQRGTAPATTVSEYVRQSVPERFRRVLDQVRPQTKSAAVPHPSAAATSSAGNPSTRLAATTQTRVSARGDVMSDAESTATDGEQRARWPMLLGALLLMGMIVRRRTAVQ